MYQIDNDRFSQMTDSIEVMIKKICYKNPFRSSDELILNSSYGVKNYSKLNIKFGTKNSWNL